MSSTVEVGLNIRLSIISSGELGVCYRGSKSATILHRELQHWPKEGTKARAFRDVNWTQHLNPTQTVLFCLASSIQKETVEKCK